MTDERRHDQPQHRRRHLPRIRLTFNLLSAHHMSSRMSAGLTAGLPASTGAYATVKSEPTDSNTEDNWGSACPFPGVLGSMGAGGSAPPPFAPAEPTVVRAAKRRVEQPTRSTPVWRHVADDVPLLSTNVYQPLALILRLSDKEADSLEQLHGSARDRERHSDGQMCATQAWVLLSTPGVQCSGARPHHLAETNTEVRGLIFKEQGRRRRMKGSDQWAASGGPKGSSVEKVAPGVLVRRKYGKLTVAGRIRSLFLSLSLSLSVSCLSVCLCLFASASASASLPLPSASACVCARV